MWLKGSVARTTPGPIITHTATWTGVAFRQRRDGTFNIATRSADYDMTIDGLLNLPAKVTEIMQVEQESLVYGAGDRRGQRAGEDLDP